jgi:hypothetical protein
MSSATTSAPDASLGSSDWSTGKAQVFPPVQQDEADEARDAGQGAPSVSGQDRHHLAETCIVHIGPCSGDLGRGHLGADPPLVIRQ